MTVSRAKILPAVANLLAALFVVYGLSVSGVLLLRIVFGERWWPIGFFNSFAHLLMFPALPFLALCFVIRRKRLALLQILPALVFLISYTSFFVPRSVQAASDKPEIGVMTYNLNKDNLAVAAVVANVKTFAPDVIAFQELNTTMAAALPIQLSEQYPYSAMYPDLEGGFTGLGILSRYPILTEQYWAFGMGHERVELDVNGVTIVVHNTHPIHPLDAPLHYNGSTRAANISASLDITDADQNLPLILLGDFNMTDQTADYQRVTSRYTDTYHEVGWGMGFTFPNLDKALGGHYLPPLARIDYVFHNSDFQAQEARVSSNSGGSDHYPLFVRLEYGS